jgi:hypothetical protein
MNFELSWVGPLSLEVAMALRFAFWMSSYVGKISTAKKYGLGNL